ncbi:MAG: glycosyltransferase family 4 protein [Candidatus Eisenbacteria bacterium]|uniref:Glycosyltransferase family 4 protein n=1 Tax=Eiseniibacteriota bacterium TaxID=2212470 RepID=A0A948RZ11_UNCEI|nr:glycosyltransferase family 4 protein [Candidatus Eisenbacteria bacterium]
MPKKMLFIYPIWGMNASFIKKDMEILNSHFDLTPLYYRQDDRLFFLRVIKHLYGKDACFVWFGGIHAFWAWLACRILGKKHIIVAGGYDAIYMPEIEHGLRFEGKGWRRAYFAFRHADLVLAVSKWHLKSLQKECGPSEKFKILYHGFADSCLISKGRQPDTVLMVCHLHKKNIALKGIEHYISVSKQMPHVKFILVGGGDKIIQRYLMSIAPKNMKILGSLPQKRVEEIMKVSKVYLQLSYVESFGCALAEAMMCGCIPVVTRGGALPEVAGDKAFYVDYGDIPAIVSAIKNALVQDNGDIFRKHILKLFPIKAREEALLRICEDDAES